MLPHYRNFELVDLFGRVWQVEFRWQQNGISIRHADTVDVKWDLVSGDQTITRVIALPHPLLLNASERHQRELTDPWCMKLAALHLKKMVETWQDMDKTLITLTKDELEEAVEAVAANEAKLREAALSA